MKGLGLEQPLNCFKLMLSLVCLIIAQAYLILVVLLVAGYKSLKERRSQTRPSLLVSIYFV